MATNWTQQIKRLGVDTDIEIAKRLGVTKERVRQKRKELGVARAPRQLSRPVRGAGAGDILNCLTTVPLSGSDRQLLTDTRVERGWSQTELAVEIGSSLAYIHAIESGKKYPSPQFLSRVCKALGLDWQCDFRLWVYPKKRSGNRPSRD